MKKRKPKARINKKKVDFAKLDIEDQLDLVQKVLEPEVYPMLEMDGGGMEIMDVEGTDILIRYLGACGNCPIAETATLPFIEQVLQKHVDPRIKVILI